jgi:dTDP-4-amino-4,6-dideoxygalactose transaminase
MSSLIPFLDLTRELLPIKENIMQKVNEIFFEKTNFILGSELETFEQHFAKYIDVNCLL